MNEYWYDPFSTFWLAIVCSVIALALMIGFLWGLGKIMDIASISKKDMNDEG